MLYISALIVVTVIALAIGAGYVFHSPPPSSSPDDIYVSVRGSKIRYHDVGDGEPTVILLHGFGGSLAEWKKIIPMFPDNRVIALDLLGFGGSDRPALSYDLETQSFYFQAFMEELDLQQTVLAGRSMGASLAAWTAAQSKEQIIGLILIAPSAYPGSLTYSWPLSWIFKPGIWNRFASFCVDNWIFRRLFPYSQAPQAVSVTSSYDSQFAEALRKIYQPTLLVWSKGDKTVPFIYNLAYRDRIQDVEFLEIPESVGHAVTRKYHDGVAASMEIFLRKFEKISLDIRE